MNVSCARLDANRQEIWLTGTVVVLSLLLGVAVRAEPVELELLATIGADEEEILLHRPEYLVFGLDDSKYVLNAGDSQVLRFDTEWNLVDQFGHFGQGPGEFETATGMVLFQDMIWVFELARATLFSLEGEYLETRTTQSPFQAPVLKDDQFIARLDGADRAAGRFDTDLELLAKLGPECPTEDFMARYQQCGFMHVLLHPDFACLLINPFDGKLYAVAEDGSVAKTVSLVDEAGESQAEQEDDTLTMSFSLVLSEGTVDAHGRLWISPANGPDDPEDAPSRLQVWSRDFELLAEFVLPEDVSGAKVVAALDGTLILLSSGNSLIHVLMYPELSDDS